MFATINSLTFMPFFQPTEESPAFEQTLSSPSTSTFKSVSICPLSLHIPSYSACFRKPNVVFFHLLFKSLAIFAYLFCQWFSDNFVMNFIFIVVLLSFDFWTVKNVSGRLLVGLRWWNRVKEDGTSEWIFEARKDAAPAAVADSRLFWYSLYITPVLWAFFAFISLLSARISWLSICIIGLVLNLANVVGYSKCEKDAQKNLQGMATNFLARQFFSRATSSVSSV
eukprot:Sdes_comp20781_c0_seq1m16863